MHINDIINSLIIGLINVIITMHFSPISLHVIMYHEEIMNRVSEFAIASTYSTSSETYVKMQ